MVFFIKLLLMLMFIVIVIIVLNELINYFWGITSNMLI